MRCDGSQADSVLGLSALFNIVSLFLQTFFSLPTRKQAEKSEDVFEGQMSSSLSQNKRFFFESCHSPQPLCIINFLKYEYFSATNDSFI